MLPPDFISQINSLLPVDEASAMLQAIASDEAVTSVRFNDAKGFLPPSSLKSVPWCPAGVYLDHRPQFTFDPLFHAGGYYVQDASSMFIYHVIKSLVKYPVSYLDLCAAPGGKTTAALQALPQGSLVVANDIVASRAQVLRENVVKWGHDNCMVVNDSPKALGELVDAFHVIAADVPCSGEGMFRKDHDAVAQWSPLLVEQCAQRQRDILAHVWPALKPGGLLIYSTCTYNLQENELMALYVARQLGASFVEVPIDHSWKITSDLSASGIPCYRFLPHNTRGEGLFVCVLKKNGVLTTNASEQREPRTSQVTKPAKRQNQPSASELHTCDQWLLGNYGLNCSGGIVTAARDDYMTLDKSQRNKLHVIKDFGLVVATIKPNKVIPSHELAMSIRFNDDAFYNCEVDYPTAIAFLRGEAITIDAPKGFVLITYQRHNLGFVNNLGSRANNLYPKNWRILSSHTPSTAFSLTTHHSF